MSKRARKIRSFAGALLLGVSGFALLRDCVDSKAIDINKMMISFVTLHDGTNTEKKGTTDASINGINAEQTSEIIDTVYAFYTNDEAENKKRQYVLNGDTVDEIPLLGLQDKYNIVIREFVSKNSFLQDSLKIYNDRYNCTRRHEYQHLLNMFYGMHGYNSPEIKFAECCLDEMSAGIAQCLEQMRNYNKNGKDENFLTNRFGFLRNAIKEGRISTDKRLTPKDQEYIANCIFDEWMDVKYDMYEERTNNRVLSYLKDALYQNVQPDWLAHDLLMRKCFNIEGYDFWPYIKKREKEIFERLSKKRREEYGELIDKKLYGDYNYIDKINVLKEIRQRYYESQNKYRYEVSRIFGSSRSR